MVLRSSRTLVGFSTAPPAFIMVLIRASSMRKSVSLFALSSVDKALISFTRITLLSPLLFLQFLVAQQALIQQVLVRRQLLLLALQVLALLQLALPRLVLAQVLVEVVFV